MVASVPALMAIMMMTAPTPMMMPSMVRKERTLFLRIASQAMRIASDGFTSDPLHHGQRMTRTVPCILRDQSVHELDGPLRMGSDLLVVGHHDDRGALL